MSKHIWMTLLIQLNVLKRKIKLRTDIEELLSKAGMKVGKLMSNSEEVLAEIPIENRSKNLVIEDVICSCATKTLGIT